MACKEHLQLSRNSSPSEPPWNEDRRKENVRDFQKPILLRNSHYQNAPGGDYCGPARTHRFTGGFFEDQLTR